MFAIRDKDYIIDITIVTERNSTKAHVQKINKHKLFQEIRDKRWIEQVKIIQSITINELVYKKWIEELRKIELKINFTKNN